jgi:Spy/CpxP family protein refolding chaperone
MKTWLAAATVLAAALPALAQDREDPVERSLRRLREDLQLTDDQVPKVREILKKQHEDVRSVLTDEQKKRYDEGGRGGPGGGRTPFAGGGSTRGGWYPRTEDMKTQLSLTDEQVTRINQARDAAREELSKFWQNRRGGGNPGEEWNAFQQKLRDETSKKIRDLLTDDQKPKFDEVVKAYQAQEQAGSGGRPRGPSTEDRVARAMELLRVENAQEAEAIKGVVKRVIEIMEKLENAQRDGRGKLEDASKNRELSEEAVGDKLDEVRKSLRDIERDLSAARKDLADIITSRQELELVRRGILK